MTFALKNRVEKMERKRRFNDWFDLERFLERFTKEQLEDIAAYWRFPDPLPEPIPFGKSYLDKLDKKTLLRMWEESERRWAGRSGEELVFYAEHYHWPEQDCADANRCCKKVGANSNAQKET